MTAIDQDFDEVYTHFSSAYSGRLAAQNLYDDDDRSSRFQASSVTDTTGRMSLRDRAASQPPRSSEQGYMSSPSSQNFVPSSLGGNGSPWSSSRLVSSSNRGQPMPIRSSSLTHNQNQFGSVMRERAFPSTLEDDEPEDYDDTYDEHFVPPSLSRGRSYGQEYSRSRSQSLANTRPGPVGSPYTGGSAMQSWNDSYLSSHTSNTHSNPLNISTGGRGYEGLQPSGTNRYGSLGALARSPSNNISSSPSPGGLVGNGYSRHGPAADGSNMSPFRRDVGQILLDDGPFRELWAGMNPPRDESGGGGGSGTTSRRHSVSVVQPRRGIVQGFNAPDAPGNESPEKSSRPAFTTYGRGGLVLSDDDLLSDLAMLNINKNEPPAPSSSHHHPVSQPASLPIYAPLSRSPPSKDLFQPMINVPASSYSASRTIATPSDGGLSAGGNHSPTARTSGAFDTDPASQYFSSATKQQNVDLNARYGSNYGIQPTTSGQQTPNALSSNAGGTTPTGLSLNPQYTRARAPSYSSQSGGVTSPISPNGTRLINPQQQPYYPQAIQRRTSDAAQHPHHHQQQGSAAQHQQGQQQQQNLNELGKGVPLSSVPATCPLFIVEFKAGRTDLFYLTDLSHDIKVGDLVIVEADRGKDLGKVVNDTITLGEVEAFQKQQIEKVLAAAGYGGHNDQPTSPGGQQPPQTSKKEISPKMIYGKASAADTQILNSKLADELKALQLCQSKVRAKKLPMEVIDAEYQWDRRKLTFYFIAEKRIDFRELVRELFRLYKTRIWMASLQGPNGYDQ